MGKSPDAVKAWVIWIIGRGVWVGREVAWASGVGLKVGLATGTKVGWQAAVKVSMIRRTIKFKQDIKTALASGVSGCPVEGV
jgi:hypothetical protein